MIKNQKKNNAKISAVAGWVPNYVLTNDELSRMVDTSNEWITTRTGIQERRILKDPLLATSDMAANAITLLLKKRNISAEEIDLIIGRLNIIQFYKLTEEEQEKLKKSCVKKVRHPNLEEAAKRIVKDYKCQKRINTYYKCPQCGGYHLTTFKGSKRKKEVLEGMIKLTIKKQQ